MNQRKYAFILLFVCIIQDVCCMRFLPPSFITNVINSKWFMPAIVVTSLALSNAINFWLMNQQVIAATRETNEVKSQIDTQRKEFINMQQEWIDLLHQKGVNTDIIRQSDQSTDAIKFTNVSQDQLKHLVAEIEKVGFTHSKEHGHYINKRALELENQLGEAERQKREADAINQAALQMEKEATNLLQEEVVKLNGQITTLGAFFKLVKTNIVIPDTYSQDDLSKVFKVLGIALQKSNTNNYSHYYDDLESGKRKIIITLESQQPLPPSKGLFSPPTQRHTKINDPTKTGGPTDG